MAVYMIVEAKEVMDKKGYGEYIRMVPMSIVRLLLYAKKQLKQMALWWKAYRVIC